MAKSLVVVESPAKAKTINKYLGRDFKVVASMGHIRDLPKSKLGVDVDNDFTEQYESILSRKKVIKELKDAAKVENLGDEIAVLRVRLKTALDERPEDYALLARGVEMLTRAVATQYRLSPKARDDLADSLAAVFNSFGDHILPPDR